MKNITIAFGGFLLIVLSVLATEDNIEPIQEPTSTQQEPTGAIIYYKCNIDTIIEGNEMYLIKFKN